MKKRIALLLALVLALSLTACGNKADDTAETKDPAETTTEPETPETPEEPEEPEEPEAPEATPLKLGDVLETDQFRMTFDSLEMVPEYTYSTSEYSSTSLYVEEGYQLLVLQGHFENKGTAAIGENALLRTATVNDTFEVDSSDVGMHFVRDKYFEIDPYTDLDYVIYINVPQKLADMYETATFTISFNNDMSLPSIHVDQDGTETVEADNHYVLTAAAGETAAASADGTAAAAGGTTTAEPAPKTIAIGDLITTDSYEFTLKSVALSYEVLPPNTSSVYSSYTAENGKVFVDVVADVKNTLQRDLRVDELFTATVLYDGQYPYDSFMAVADDNSFTWAGNYVAATPLETCTAHAIIECPVEVDTSGKSIVVTITLGQDEYEYTLR